MRLLPLPVTTFCRLITGLAPVWLLGCGAGEDLGGPELGTVEVVTRTSGDGGDPDGYTVTIDEAEVFPIEQADTVRVGDLQPARHVVTLGGLSESCMLKGENPRTVSLAAGVVVAVTFQVECAAAPLVGRLEVETVTSGIDLDPDGYAVVLDPDIRLSIGPNEVAAVDDVAEGERAVRLEGVASNCSIRGDNPRIVTVQAAAPIRTLFEVTCWPPATGRIAFVLGSFGTIEGSDIYIREADGTRSKNLTETLFDSEKDPAWSPDGTRLVFVRNENDGGLNQMYVVSAGGGAPTKFLPGVDAEAPRWSPDGGRLLYLSGLSLWTVNANGTGQRQLTSDTLQVTSATWSPDGQRIAFDALRQDENFFFISHRLYQIDSSGGGLIDLSAGLDLSSVSSVAWSPDGSRIACVILREGGEFFQLATISADGRTLTVLRDSADFDSGLSWSPDGTKLAFTATVDLTPENPADFEETDVIFVMNADGSGLRPLTGINEFAESPAWGP